MKATSFIIILFLTACSPTVVGTLVDTRDYENTMTIGDEHDEFSSYHAMLANLPASILTRNKRKYYLIFESRFLSEYATDWIQVQGIKERATRRIIPKKIWVKKNSEWILIYEI